VRDCQRRSLGSGTSMGTELELYLEPATRG